MTLASLMLIVVKVAPTTLLQVGIQLLGVFQSVDRSLQAMTRHIVGSDSDWEQEQVSEEDQDRDAKEEEELNTDELIDQAATVLDDNL
jgi:hypothetical protein